MTVLLKRFNKPQW